MLDPYCRYLIVKFCLTYCNLVWLYDLRDRHIVKKVYLVSCLAESGISVMLLAESVNVSALDFS